MFIKSITAGGHISFSYYRDLFSSTHEWELFKHSFLLAITTAISTTLIGMPLGILVGKTDLPFRKIFTFLFTIPLLIPPYIIAISWSNILGQQGIISRIFGQGVAFIISKWFFGFSGCVLVLFSVFLPIVILLTMASLNAVNPKLEEAGIILANPLYVLRKITIPLILPGVFLATLLVFILTLGEMGVPIFLRYKVFSVESFIQFSAFYNFGFATASAVPLLFITFIILIIEAALLRKRDYQFAPAPEYMQVLELKLGHHKKIFLFIVGLLCFFIVIIPLSALFFQSLSIQAYKEAILRTALSLFRSISYAMIGATLLTIFGFFLGYLIYNKISYFWNMVDFLTVFLFALPATVIGIGMISLWNNAITNFIYSTPIIIIIGYVIHYTAITSRVMVSTIANIPPSMEEAAQIAGASWLRIIFYIIAPMSKYGLIAAWIIGYIFCMRDMGITMLVYPPGHDTFPVRIFTLMANASSSLVAALCVIMLIAILVPFIVGIIILKNEDYRI